MALPQLELVTSMVTAFRADATLQGLITGATAPTWNIFDSVPTNQGFPYVVINDIAGSRGTLLTMPYGKANDLLVQVDVFSQYSGFREAQLIASRIDTLLNEVSLIMPDFINPFTLLNGYSQNVENDGITHRVMAEYFIMTQGG